MTTQPSKSPPSTTGAPGAQPPYGSRPLRITLLGLRGYPDIQGGVERHVEHLAPRLAREGCDVEVIVRKPYVEPKHPSVWNNIKLQPISCPTNKSTEAAVHTFLGVLHAAFRRRPDVLHIHAVGPMLMVPLARLLGLRVVVTHHGYDYDRDKWGRVAKTMLKLGEWLGMRISNRRIAVSRSIAGSMRAGYYTDVAAIPNGVNPPPANQDAEAIRTFGLEPGKYVLAVGRLVPEKRHKDLITAFAASNLAGWKLAIVGAADHPDAYSRSVEDLAAQTDNVVMTGFQKGAKLDALYAQAGLFALVSSHEGLPIALLEALSYGLPCVASDIEANLEVGLADEDYYPVTDVDALTRQIATKAGHGLSSEAKEQRTGHVAKYFSWDQIAHATIGVYRSAMHLPVEAHIRSRPHTDKLGSILSWSRNHDDALTPLEHASHTELASSRGTATAAE
ncbi:MAG: glycosyltransferase family 4 protein [Pseudomonadota bacterium]